MRRRFLRRTIRKRQNQKHELCESTLTGLIVLLKRSKLSLEYPTELLSFYFMGTISALLFRARPASVSLGAIGFLYPKPTIEIRDS